MYVDISLAPSLSHYLLSLWDLLFGFLAKRRPGSELAGDDGVEKANERREIQIRGLLRVYRTRTTRSRLARSRGKVQEHDEATSEGEEKEREKRCRAHLRFSLRSKFRRLRASSFVQQMKSAPNQQRYRQEGTIELYMPKISLSRSRKSEGRDGGRRRQGRRRSKVPAAEQRRLQLDFASSEPRFDDLE